MYEMYKSHEEDKIDMGSRCYDYRLDHWFGDRGRPCVYPGQYGQKKGYSYGAFWAFGFFLFLPAIIVAAVIEDKTKPAYPPYGPPPYGQPPYGQPNGQPYGQPYQQQPYQQPYQQSAAQPEAQPAASCPGCGAPVSADSAFCPACGTRVK